MCTAFVCRTRTCRAAVVMMSVQYRMQTAHAALLKSIKNLPRLAPWWGLPSVSVQQNKFKSVATHHQECKQQCMFHGRKLPCAQTPSARTGKAATVSIFSAAKNADGACGPVQVGYTCLSGSRSWRLGGSGSRCLGGGCCRCLRNTADVWPIATEHQDFICSP